MTAGITGALGTRKAEDGYNAGLSCSPDVNGTADTSSLNVQLRLWGTRSWKYLDHILNLPPTFLEAGSTAG